MLDHDAMLFAKELLCLYLGGWLVVSTHDRLVRKGFGWAWRVWFILLSVAGIALAFRLMNIRYLVSPTSRVYGVPFVIAGGELINGQWADGGVGLYMPLPFLANLAFGISSCLIPFTILSIFYASKSQKGSNAA
jgi:hypothetical protein